MDHDVIIIGGSFAGMAAATYLARGRRKVCVVDSDRPRNRFAESAHGFLSRDGSNPLAIRDAARQQLSAYPTVQFIQGEVVQGAAEDDGFAFTLADGSTINARKAILAFGLRDELPRIDGLAERWGKTVLHCPYCHGIEFSDRELGVLYRMPMSVHQALLIAEWGPTTLYLNGATLDDEDAARLEARGVRIRAPKVARLLGDGYALAGVELDDGSTHELAALYIAPQSFLASPLAEQLDCAIEDTPMGPKILTDAERLTNVPSLYAAGDIARAPHSVSWAAADGVTAGTSAHRALVFG